MMINVEHGQSNQVHDYNAKVPILCDCNDEYLLVKGTMITTAAAADAAARNADDRNKRVTFKSLAK